MKKEIIEKERVIEEKNKEILRLRIQIEDIMKNQMQF